jgi:Arc/MetJ-type ribon-helix-helix transcriptional regulator
MNTINISLPDRLKEQATDLVKKGHYASFSDLVRDSIRQLISKNKYDLWVEETKLDLARGRAKVLKSGEEIDEYVKSL